MKPKRTTTNMHKSQLITKLKKQKLLVKKIAY